MPRILLIEDEEGFGEALEYQLKREGFEVNRYTDGADRTRALQDRGRRSCACSI